MSLAQIFTAYAGLNLMIIVAFAVLKIIRLPQKNSTQLKIHYAVLVSICGMTLAHPLLPKKEFFKPAAKLWAANSIRSFTKEYYGPYSAGVISVPELSQNSSVNANFVSIAWGLGFLIIFSLGTTFVIRDLKTLIRIRRSSYLSRKIGHLSIYINDTIKIPFSYWLPFQANIVVPNYLLSKRSDFKIAVHHELQHHRNRDTVWVYVLWGLKVTCATNPAIYLWTKWISELQEFAVDEALIEKNKIDLQDYARCLVEVAQTAINQKFNPTCATGLTFLVERNILKRRIESMFQKTSRTISRKISLGFAALVISLLSVVAYATKGLVEDRRISMHQAHQLAKKARVGSEIPVEVNDLVLAELNRYLGTPEGREFMRASLQRMKAFKTVIDEYIVVNNMPSEILAIPIVESGYRNLTEEESNTSGRAAGLWQFIPSTARIFGLKVNETIDERLDVPLASDASMRLLMANKLRFKDWLLSIMAYNFGAKNLQNAIDETGSRDAWTLIRLGHEGDKNYLAKFMAALIILKNPEVL